MDFRKPALMNCFLVLLVRCGMTMTTIPRRRFARGDNDAR
jgi:hypothetical protein